MKEKIQLNSDAVQLRLDLGEDRNSPIDIFSLIHKYSDLTLVFHPMSKSLSGMCIRDGTNKVIGVNSNSTYGRQRFTVAHELYHLFFQEKYKSIICPADIGLSKDVQEKEADSFASYFLAPYDALALFVRDLKGEQPYSIDLDDVVRIEQHFAMSRQATLWRLVNDKYITLRKANTMRSGVKASAMRLGYDTTLYSPTPEHKTYATYGKYIRLAEELKAQDLISDGKYDELLLDAFRADIVYGFDEETDEIYD